jgi:hypothetical protein
MPNTYTELLKTTVVSSTPSVTFSSISSAYTDLVLVFSGTMTASARIDLRVGNTTLDTGSNYSNTEILGTGSSATSYRYANGTTMQGPFDAFGTGTGQVDATFHFQNYSNTTTYKTVLGRSNSASNGTGAFVGLWRSTSAINTISIIPTSNFATGTFSLYGILAT